MDHLKYLVTVDLPKNTVIAFNTDVPLEPISMKSVGENKVHTYYPHSCEIRTYWNPSQGVTEVSSNFPIEIYEERDTEVLLKVLIP